MTENYLTILTTIASIFICIGCLFLWIGRKIESELIQSGHYKKNNVTKHEDMECKIPDNLKNKLINGHQKKFVYKILHKILIQIKKNPQKKKEKTTKNPPVCLPYRFAYYFATFLGGGALICDLTICMNKGQ